MGFAKVALEIVARLEILMIELEIQLLYNFQFFIQTYLHPQSYFGGASTR